MFHRLQRLLGASEPFDRSASPDTTPHKEKIRSAIFDRSTNVVDVVGESHRQAALELIGGGLGPNGVRSGNHVAGLLPEPDNPVDPQAVAVQIDARHVGYLSREDARAYRPVIDRLLRHGLFTGCHASLTGGWERSDGTVGSIGVRLHMGTPAELWAELDRDDGPETPPVSLRAAPSSSPAVPLSQPINVSEWDGEFAGKSVCFTGYSGFVFRGATVTHVMQELLAVQHGMTVRPTVSKKLDILVIGPDHLRTGKARKAEEYGTTIVDEAAFWSKLGVTFEG